MYVKDGNKSKLSKKKKKKNLSQRYTQHCYEL